MSIDKQKYLTIVSLNIWMDGYAPDLHEDIQVFRPKCFTIKLHNQLIYRFLSLSDCQSNCINKIIA